MPRTLITGGAGFLGSHLCDYLLNKGHEVICMDNLITGSLTNIDHIKSEKFIFVEPNVTNYIDIEGFLYQTYLLNRFILFLLFNLVCLNIRLFACIWLS